MTELSSQFKTWMNAYGKVISLVVTMLIGALLPQASALSFMVQYLLMVMLFFAFLDIEVNPKNFHKGVLWVLLANLAVAFAAYEVFSRFSADLGLAAFITAIAPTAISSTVIVSFIEGRVDFMVAAVLLTNITMALVVPIALPFVVGATIPITTWDVLQPVLITMFAPLILARLVAHLPQNTQSVIRSGKRFSFPLWILNLFIISAKASDFVLRENSSSLVVLGQIAIVSFIICVVNFGLGALLGGRRYWQESSQALGQKNNSFSIWVALTFISPLAAMGPTFYVLYHNLYNTWQIYRFEKRNKETL
jgi:bile acid:Na+ symporter, BASS family